MEKAFSLPKLSETVSFFTPTIDLLLNKGDKFELKAFLMNSLRTEEPPQPMTVWKQRWVQQLLRWSTERQSSPVQHDSFSERVPNCANCFQNQLPISASLGKKQHPTFSPLPTLPKKTEQH